MNPQDLFDKMPAAFNPAAAEGVTAVIQIELTGDNAGTWVINIADGKVDVSKDPVEDPTMTLTMDSNDYTDMVSGTLNPMNAFMQGKIKLAGDMGLAMKFQSMFKM